MGGAISIFDFDDNVIDSVICGGNTPAPGILDNPNIQPTDTAEVGVGDIVGADCEEIVALVACPSGGTCSGTPEVTGPGGGAGSSLSGSKGGKGRNSNVLGSSDRKVKIKGGKTGLAYVQMDRKKVKKALKKRDEIPATLQLASKGGKGKARKSATARKVRFKLKK